MTAQIAWLDASAEEQRRVREVVQLFAQSETVDELGGRKIVITFADALFPGTSVLHSRARYLLFIPWFCQVAVTRKNPRSTLDALERTMIESFKAAGEVDGLVGREAGARVKQLPSTMYWTTLEAWGVLRTPGTITHTLQRQPPSAALADDQDERSDRLRTIWDPHVGSPPIGFPAENIDGGFSLKPAEAEWLRDRLLLATDGSLLAHLIRTEQPLSAGTSAPWEEPISRTAPPEIRAILDDAERFALATQGARLLYSLLVARAYTSAGFNKVEVDESAVIERLDAWAKDVRSRRDLFEQWDPTAFWEFVAHRNSRVDPFARQFFDRWLDLAVRADVSDLAERSDLHGIIREREQFLKRGQARLVNPKLLAAWNGGTAASVTYRWGQVRQMVSDVIDGLEAAHAGA